MWGDICTSEGDVMFGKGLISIFSRVFVGTRISRSARGVAIKANRHGDGSAQPGSWS